MHKYVRVLIYIVIIGILIFNSPEYAFNLGLIPARLENSPVYIKVGKDVIFVAIILLSFLDILRKSKIFKLQIYFLILLIYIFICCIFTADRSLCVAGIRWIIPFILTGAVYPYIDVGFIKKITRILFVLLILQVGTQIIELFVMPPVQGVNSLGLSNRVPGLFYISNTASVFVLFSYFYIRTFEISKRIKKLGLILTISSLVLMMSSTGVFVFLIMFLFDKSYSSRYFKVLLFFSPIVVFVLFTNLDLLTGRGEGDTIVSGSTRLSILSECINETSIISDSFGEATNTAVNLNLKRAFIADSNIIALYHNLGLIGFMFCFTSFIYLILIAWLKKRKDFILFLIAYFLCNMPLILFEIFPSNIIASILLAYFIKNSLYKGHCVNIAK
ncbi:hypothetical protein [Phocaeicola coprophilus]|uniref:hypothetical protein n=1 Tax=Phocaeicola coprophilus TaxID=387090 RepID=UPI00255D0DAA|nr:hypothetical protein [Phocaeicola coprophilus]